MRAWLLVALLGCGHDRAATHEVPNAGSAAPVATGSAAPVAATGSADDDLLGQRIADEIVKLPSNRLVYLPDLGWIQIKEYAAYKGRNPQTGSAVDVPAKRLPFWTTSPILAAEVAHAPPPQQPAAWRDERGRYMAAIHDGDQNPVGEDPDLDVIRLNVSDELADRVRRDLLATGSADIPHVAHLAIEGSHVTFETSPELEQRLNVQ